MSLALRKELLSLLFLTMTLKMMWAPPINYLLFLSPRSFFFFSPFLLFFPPSICPFLQPFIQFSLITRPIFCFRKMDGRLVSLKKQAGRVFFQRIFPKKYKIDISMCTASVLILYLINLFLGWILTQQTVFFYYDVIDLYMLERLRDWCMFGRWKFHNLVHLCKFLQFFCFRQQLI